MILSIIIIAIVGLVAYFHYVQGFFSATLSAIIAAISAVLALSYYEPIVNNWLGGKFADTAPAMTLCILFAVIYLVIRTAVDSFVPGNLRLPVFAEKVGAGLMGLVAGIFAGGIVAITAQMLPFGASVGGFSRYQINDARDVRLPTTGQMEDTFVYEELKDHTIEENRQEDRQRLWLPADEMVLETVQRLSNEGSLAGRQSLKSIHPDLPEELFLSNIGIQIGAKRTAINSTAAKREDVKVPTVFTIPSVAQSDGEIPEIRSRKLPATLSPKGSEMILVVRTIFERQATDTDNRTRFSTGSARLVVNGQNYYPVGTLEKGSRLYANSLDDFLVAESGKGADLVYIVPKSDVLADSKAPAEKQTIADGVFLEVKRLGHVDLGGKKLVHGFKASEDVGVMRKPELVTVADKALGKGSAGDSSADNAAPAGPLQYDSVQADPKLPHKVGTGTADKSGSFQTASATGSLQDGKFAKLEVNGTESVQRMSAGSYAVDELAAPAGQKVVKVHLIPQGDNPWAFESQIANYQLSDDKDQKHAPYGVAAAIKTSDGGDRLVASYNSSSPSANIPHAEGRPTDVWIFYVIPSGTHITSLTLSGKNAGAAELTVD